MDPLARTAYVEAGARFADVIPKAAPHGLAPLNGSAPHVGVVAYTLGGGLALLGRSHGYAADRVRAMDVVTADGRLRHVTVESDPDLYWALLGGRDNFGIVIGMEFGLVPVARLYGGALFFDARQVPGVLDGYRRWTATVPTEMNSSAALIPVPDDPQVPEPMRGRLAVVNPLSPTTVEDAHAFLDRLFGDLQPWTAGRSSTSWATAATPTAAASAPPTPPRTTNG
ncbi:FAD-binding protein [Nonomuraea sp. LPB2021202275-12-8]|uniref:FAD-binding protein n=1 Tax=Nonomuraea sp. LPB2021202275-12-8 TaxID=3120159 RepID=UPI00300D86D5